MKRSFIIFVMNCNVIYFFSPVDLSYTSQRGEGADSLEYSRTFHWGNHLNGAKSQTAQSGNTTHWRASIILLLKNIFTSNSLYRISISCCPPFHVALPSFVATGPTVPSSSSFWVFWCIEVPAQWTKLVYCFLVLRFTRHSSDMPQNWYRTVWYRRFYLTRLAQRVWFLKCHV